MAESFFGGSLSTISGTGQRVITRMAKILDCFYSKKVTAWNIAVMKKLILVSCLATAAAFCWIYKIGAPCNGYVEANALLPFVAFLLAAIPLVAMQMKVVDSTDKRSVALVYVLVLALPSFMLYFGHQLLIGIGSLGSPGC